MADEQGIRTKETTEVSIEESENGLEIAHQEDKKDPAAEKCSAKMAGEDNKDNESYHSGIQTIA